MAQRRFLLVDSEVLPAVFVKVLEAKELLASGAVASISAAAKQSGISRSAFYKYKDCVFDAENGRESITVIATLRDRTGALQELLSGISAAGASVAAASSAGAWVAAGALLPQAARARIMRAASSILIILLVIFISVLSN